VVVIASLIIGAALGGLTARRRGGKRLDVLQYAAGYAIAFTILGLFATIFIDRMAR
jgi:hypothetical protein